MKTWHLEMTAVATVLVAVALTAGGGVVELIGAAAVLLSFGHAQVANRLEEAEQERRSYVYIESIDRHSVHCYRWATRYLVGKESLWCVYFVLHRSWSALAGVVLFLSYPMWRRWWRAHRPLGAS